MALILLIEDNIDIRENTGELLTLQGFSFLEANDGGQGIQLAKQKKPDIILCDIMMPAPNGYEVLKEIRNDPVTAMIPFIFFTAYSEKKNVEAALALGANGYILKPFSAGELFSEIRKFLP
jgi:CheY-like chemotaxis protein